ncbi:MAG TPA: metalloregulator ArsR/SmtB family transcription factor [Phycisphaerae bacterium]|nr:metalloregulator ArsR/SmtB family transcription factor [Phycisphaerae bacterium]
MDIKESRLDYSASDPAEVFRVLGDETRLAVMQLLIIEELNVGELVEILGLPQSTVSRHLKALREVNLLRDRRVGATALYSVAKAATSNHANGSNEEHLPDILTHWLKAKPLAAALRQRMNRVLSQRRTDSHGFFNRLGRRWDELRTEAFGSSFALEAFLTLLPREWTVADLGTGTGYLLAPLASRFQQVIAVEPAEGMMEWARRRIAQAKLTNVDLRAGDLTRLPIEDAAVDLAVAMLVLHHVADVDEALREMMRATRPGGRILIVEQTAHENQAFYDRMQDRWWGFDADDLGRRLAAAGCDQVESHRLITAGTVEGSLDAPPLFVLTGIRPIH